MLRLLDRRLKPEEWHEYSPPVLEGFRVIATKDDQKYAGLPVSAEAGVGFFFAVPAICLLRIAGGGYGPADGEEMEEEGLAGVNKPCRRSAIIRQ